MKKISLTFSLLIYSLIGYNQSTNNQCPDYCDAVLLLGFNEFEIYTQNDLNSAYAEMLSKSDIELDELSSQSSSGRKLGGKLKLISASWSKNKNNSSWKKNFNAAREAYQKSGALNTNFIQESASKTVNNNAISAWRKCKEDLFECIKATNNQTENRTFTTEIAGDLNGDFTLIVHFIPNNSGENKPTRIISVNYSSDLVPRGPSNLKKDEFIYPYTGLSQSFTRINKDNLSSITINIEGSSPIIINLPSKSKVSYDIPLGTIIASTLTYTELCRSIGEQITYNNKNTWAPADGRGVIGSDLGKISNTVPDLRGVFLRGLNKFYQDNNGAGAVKVNQLDVDNNRNAGSFQPESTKLPNKNFRTNRAGKHDHQYTHRYVGGENGPIQWGASADRKTQEKLTGESGVHEHIIIGGDEETRPKNVAVYYYIKIN